MRILRRYLFRTIMANTALVLAVLLALGMFIEFVDELGNIGKGDYGTLQALIFAALELPHYAFRMLPMAALLGAMLGLGNLATQSELIAIRAGGVSPMRLASAVGSTGAVLGLLALALGGWLAPPMDNYARQFRAEAKYGPQSIVAGKAVWIRDGNTFLQVTRMNQGNGFGGLFLFRLDPGQALEAIGHADSAQVGADNAWVLDNYTETTFGDERVSVRSETQATEPNSLPPDMLGLTVVREESLDAVSLFRYVRFRQQSGLNAEAYIVAFWQRIAASVATIAMCVLALPFAFGSLRSSGTGARVAVGVIIGLAYFMAANGLIDGGSLYSLNPIVTAWLPTIALSFCVVVALSRTR